jgi:hypothetical protein
MYLLWDDQTRTVGRMEQFALSLGKPNGKRAFSRTVKTVLKHTLKQGWRILSGFTWLGIRTRGGLFLKR